MTSQAPPTPDSTARPRVLFIHGLEGHPQGTKALFLARHFTALTPAMDTSDFEKSVATQAEAIATFRPDLIVGSSFGGAVAVTLMQRGVWKNPTVLLAPAAAKLGLPNRLPEGVVVTVVHAQKDALISREDCAALAATGTPGLVRLEEVEDEHRLQTLVDSGRLAALVLETWARR